MRENVSEMPEYCTVEAAMEVVGGKWKMAILNYLTEGPRRFGELKRALPSITQRMLTRQLRELEADGIVLRTVYAQVPPKVEYSLTAIGKSLEDILKRLEEWGAWYREQRLP
ncbi:transcriptional regulator, HxlR family [Saccharopolyspora kobensis]|uniref:Transcriptional regulator, HxlR family n=2 Tax=Saccharopolyspora kobensis TaxID=146035 RepID=A0A1H5ZT60_9PSEU|nr:transcriptional regulator, HxlR family [Saccharopolyspora kobensis]SFE12646.1 transcriptional regulator, HxlR family [Saccharopolyspora kobensis]